MAKNAAAATNALRVRTGRTDALPWRAVSRHVSATLTAGTTNRAPTASAKKRRTPPMTTAAPKTTTAPTLCVVMTGNAATRTDPEICAADDRVTSRALNASNAMPRKRDVFPSRTVTPRPAPTMLTVKGTKSVITAIALCRTAIGAAVAIEIEAVIEEAASTMMTVLGIKSAAKATARCRKCRRNTRRWVAGACGRGKCLERIRAADCRRTSA